jgi:hypothetical protein
MKEQANSMPENPIFDFDEWTDKLRIDLHCRWAKVGFDDHEAMTGILIAHEDEDMYFYQFDSVTRMPEMPMCVRRDDEYFDITVEPRQIIVLGDVLQAPIRECKYEVGKLIRTVVDVVEVGNDDTPLTFPMGTSGKVTGITDNGGYEVELTDPTLGKVNTWVGEEEIEQI